MTNSAEGVIYRRDMVKEAPPPMGTEKMAELEKEVVVEKEVAVSPDASQSAKAMAGVGQDGMAAGDLVDTAGKGKATVEEEEFEFDLFEGMKE